MRTHVALAWLVAASPALAQELPGIDLSNPPPEEKEQPQGEEQAPIDLTQPPGPREAAARPAARAPERPFRVDDVALGDKVKAVQRKGFLKRGRFEVTPLLALQLNDAFYQKFGGALRVAYHLQESFALAVRGTYYEPYRTDNVRTGKVAFGSQLLNSQIDGQLMLDGMWSPVYGKSAFLGKSIVHFDLFLQAGAGVVWTATSRAPRDEGPHVATDVGGGFRFYPKSWLAVELGLTGTFYPDQPMESVPGTIQKIIVANVGFSFFLPTGFEYVHP